MAIDRTDPSFEAALEGLDRIVKDPDLQRRLVDAGLLVRVDDREARYQRGRSARAEVERRVLRAIDRLDVALQFDRPNSATLAQSLHAIHHLERGWASDSTRELVDDAPDFQLSASDAEDLARLLATMLEQARNARSTVAEAE